MQLWYLFDWVLWCPCNLLYWYTILHVTNILFFYQLIFVIFIYMYISQIYYFITIIIIIYIFMQFSQNWHFFHARYRMNLFANQKWTAVALARTFVTILQIVALWESRGWFYHRNSLSTPLFFLLQLFLHSHILKFYLAIKISHSHQFSMIQKKKHFLFQYTLCTSILSFYKLHALYY